MYMVFSQHTWLSGMSLRDIACMSGKLLPLDQAAFIDRLVLHETLEHDTSAIDSCSDEGLV